MCGLQFVNHLTFSNNLGPCRLNGFAKLSDSDWVCLELKHSSKSSLDSRSDSSVFSALEPSVWVSALSLANRKPDSQFDFVKCVYLFSLIHSVSKKAPTVCSWPMPAKHVQNLSGTSSGEREREQEREVDEGSNGRNSAFRSSNEFEQSLFNRLPTNERVRWIAQSL